MADYLYVEVESKTIKSRELHSDEDGRDQEVTSSKGASNEQCLLEVADAAGDKWKYQSIDDDELGNRAASLSLSYDESAHDAAEWDKIREERNDRLYEMEWTDRTNIVTSEVLTQTEQDNWRTYLQELRDLPANTADPKLFDWDNDWPTKPY